MGMFGAFPCWMKAGLLLVILLPVSSGQNLDTASIAGIAGGSTVALLLAFGIILMCGLIYNKSAGTTKRFNQSDNVRSNRFQRQVPRRPAYEQNNILSAAPNTITYGAPPNSTYERTNVASLFETPMNSLLGSSMIGAGPQMQLPSINELTALTGNGAGIINSQVNGLNIQEVAVPLNMGYNDTYM